MQWTKGNESHDCVEKIIRKRKKIVCFMCLAFFFLFFFGKSLRVRERNRISQFSVSNKQRRSRAVKLPFCGSIREKGFGRSLKVDIRSLDLSCGIKQRELSKVQQFARAELGVVRDRLCTPNLFRSNSARCHFR